MFRKIGFIGLGEMGLPMARNLLKAGHSVAAYDLRLEAVNEVVKSGGTMCQSVKEIGELCDLVVVMVRTTEQVEGVMLEKHGLLESCKKGACIVIMSTIDPLTVKKIASAAKERSIDVMDAPVSGGRQGAEAGSLSVMVGGDKVTYEKLVPILKTLGKKVIYLGSNGMGEVAKIVNNLLLLINMNAAYEAIELASKAGLPTEALLTAVTPSTGNSWVLEHWEMVRSWKVNYKTGGTLDLVYKDFMLAYKLAQDLKVPLHLGAQASQLGRY